MFKPERFDTSQRKIELGMVYELAGEYIEVVPCCEELLAKGYLVVERETEGGLTVYRLKS